MSTQEIIFILAALVFFITGYKSLREYRRNERLLRKQQFYYGSLVKPRAPRYRPLLPLIRKRKKVSA